MFIPAYTPLGNHTCSVIPMCQSSPYCWHLEDQLLYCSYKSVKTAATHFQFKQQHAVATYPKVSRWQPRNTDAFYLTRLNRSLHRFNSESLLLQEWQAIKTELHVLRETHTTHPHFCSFKHSDCLLKAALPKCYMWAYGFPDCFCPLKLQGYILFIVSSCHKIPYWNNRIRPVIQFCAQTSVFQN